MKVLFLAVGLQLSLCFVSNAEVIETGSCEDRCGIYNESYPCHCNYACVRKNDCCDDVLQKCTRIRLVGNNTTDVMRGVVIIEEKTRGRMFSYVCQSGKWLLFEASAACADLGYHGNAMHYSIIDEDPDLPILHSYVECGPDKTSLQQCEFTTNITKQKLCKSNTEDGCCKGLVGLTCTNETDEYTTTVDAEVSIISTTTTKRTNENIEFNPNTDDLNPDTKDNTYIYIIAGVSCAVLIMIAAVVVVLKSRGKAVKQLRYAPATNDSTVAMGNITSDQSADPAPTPFLGSEVPRAEENTYASDPTSLHTGVGSMGSGMLTDDQEDHDYSYVDVVPGRGQSEDLIHTYMYAVVSPESSQNASLVTPKDDNDYGLTDNILYGQS